ncbi:MAG TPA: ImmA/IrrE family metallo-endopeptidase [Phenylobacterium sp.]|uniref:ImmA/IrrE family metallo-endopeptidase n=1 Tax=Phenylobacterium sp. TaxID=1871053 RepID=UPI002B483DC7|nr:ImmA/IrrE family metallo-endopeptidase [Phenylobacterium sp.]HKR87985.1 ImmA/IrrE family metallo-endopeptidase [Phenylobacterium sp.]
MITPFGIATRKLRLDKGLRLLDLASLLNLSSSFVSAVETGKRPIPSGYVQSVCEVMKLTPDEAVELQKAADRSRSAVDVDGLRGPQRELVAAFARQLDELPPELLEEIKQKVFKSTTGETPFRRRRKGLMVAPASTKALWTFAEQVRATFVNSDEIYFPIMDVLEFRLQRFFDGFYVDPCSKEEMGSEEGLVIAGENCIKLREDVYEGAWNDIGRDRFTACHEFGHFLMHRQITMARVRDDASPIYCDAEWQADTFAGALLMSANHLPEFPTSDAAAIKCGMTPMAATVMWSKYKKEGV